MKFQYPSIILLIFFFYACSNSNSIDNKIVLKIGQLEITKYEFERNKTRELGAINLDSSAVNENEKISKWKKDYIDRCIIIADAYENKFDTIKYIQKDVKYVGDFMMTQRYGYLWQKTIAPIVGAFQELTDEKLEKRKKIFYVDYISCNNIEDLKRLNNNDTIVANKESFIKLKRNWPTKNKIFDKGYFSFQWPFIAYWNFKDYIYELKEGDVSKLLKNGNYYTFILVDHIEEIMINQDEKDKMLTELQIGKEGEIISELSKDIYNKCKPKFNNANIDSIVQFINKGNPITNFKNNIELVQYNINDTLHKVSFNEFIEYYSFLLMKNEIKNKETFMEEISNYYNQQYLKNEAIKHNLYNSEKFLLDKKNFQNIDFYNYYIKNKIINNIKIDSVAIQNYYFNNKQLFEQSQLITANIYQFKNAEAAQKNQFSIQEMIEHNKKINTQDTTLIQGLVKYTPGLKIDIDSKSYTKEFITTLQATPLGSLSQSPILYNGNYILFHKVKEEGKCIKKIEDVYSNIENHLIREIMEKERKALVEKLRNKYIIEIDKTGV